MSLGTVVVLDNYFYLNIHILNLTSHLKTVLFHITGNKGSKTFKRTNLPYKSLLSVAVYSNYSCDRSLPVN